MSAVYTHQVFFTHGSAGELYTVPDGYRLVLRWLTGFNPDGVLDHIIHVTETTTGLTIVQANLHSQQYESIELRVAVDQGQELRNDSDGEIDLTATGYLLTLP